jgi:hypothetical protein
MNSPFHPEVLPGFAAYHRPMAGGPHQFRTRNDLAETNAIERGRKRSKINEAGRYPAAHNGLVAGSSPAGPTNEFSGMRTEAFPWNEAPHYLTA